MSTLDVLDLPQLYTKPSSETLLQTLALLTSTPRTWDRTNTQHVHDVQVNPEGVTRYLTSIVSSGLQWIQDDEAKEEVWSQASMRLSERSGRSAMGAISRSFTIPSPSGSFDISIYEPALTGDDLGLKTWAASYLLAKRLHTLNLIPADVEARMNVLELGSGTGLVGLAMAGLGADVVLTDMSSIHTNLARNVENNAHVVADGGGSAHTGILDWTNPTLCKLSDPADDSNSSTTIRNKFPLILAADSLYSPEHPHMLVDTIESWLSNDRDAKVIVEFPYRDAYLPEIASFRDRMKISGLRILQEGEEQGYDDWGSGGSARDNDDDDDDSAVTCWWSVWGRRTLDDIDR